MTTSSTHQHSGDRAAAWVSAVWLPALVLLPVPLFWYGFTELASGWQRKQAVFQPLVPFICLLMLLVAVRSVPAENPRDRWLGVPGIAVALIVAGVANLVLFQHGVYLAMILYAAALIVTFLGTRGALAASAPLAGLVAMLPLPQFVYADAQYMLEQVAAGVALAALRPLDIPAAVEGRAVAFAGGELHLGAALGLQNLGPIFLASLLYAACTEGPRGIRLLPLVMALPLTVVMAAVQLTAIGAIIDRGGPDAATALLTLSNGGGFFIAAMSAAVLGAAVAGRMTEPVSVLRPAAVWSGLRSRARQLVEGDRFGPPAVAALVAVAISAGFHFAPALPSAAVARERLSLFPVDLGAWSGSSSAIDPEVDATLQADDYLQMDYWSQAERAPVNLWIAYYGRQGGRDGAVHSPRVCLPSDGWNLVSLRESDVQIPGGAVTVNRAIIQRGDSLSLVYYWFEGRGRRSTNEFMARVLYRLDGIVKGRSDGALVRFVTQIVPGEGEGEADARVQRLMAATLQHLPRFIPE